MAKKQVKKENGWIKFLRVVLYAISIAGALVGASLIKAGGLSASYADGTYAAKIQNGEIIFFSSLIVLVANIMWGILRWFLRGLREQWKAGRIIGKLIGGGIWRAFAIAPLVLLSLLFLAPKISDIIANNVTSAEIELVSLSENYERLKYLDDNFDTLDIEKIKSELDGLMFNNVEFGLDASSNIAYNRSSILFQNVSAYSSSVTVLNKAKLSNGGHFVVFYTDTGDDKISDAKAAELAEMLETIIVGYKNNLGLDYEYEKIANNTKKLGDIQTVLKNSNIDENILDSAMPVYVVNPYEEDNGTLATYAGRRFKDLGAAILVKLGSISIFKDDTMTLYNSTPSYPFVNILPANADSSSLAIVAAHELGHHYAGTYNYKTYGKTGSDDDFIDETTPNWMAINALPNQPADSLTNGNHYNYAYLEKSTSVKIDGAAPTFLGYPAVAFLENYYEIVPNAKTIIMDATYYGDALNYLYEKAGVENYRKVMISLAEKNLTGDYDGKLINTKKPKGEVLQCADICSSRYFINPSATEYLYFATSEYHDVKIGFRGSGNVDASILGMKYNGDFEVIESGKKEIEFTIADDEIEKYEMIAVAVANSSISESGMYAVDITAKELEDLLAISGNFNFGNIYTDLGAGCYEINTDSIFDNLLGFVDLGSNFIAAIDRLSSEDYSEAQNAYDEMSIEAKNNIVTARNELSPYRVTICANYIKPGKSFDEVKRKLQTALSQNINFYDERFEGDRFSVFVGFNLFTRSGKVHVLAEHENEMGLITIGLEEK